MRAAAGQIPSARHKHISHSLITSIKVKYIVNWQKYINTIKKLKVHPKQKHKPPTTFTYYGPDTRKITK
jgi:hypothetical protein